MESKKYISSMPKEINNPRQILHVHEIIQKEIDERRGHVQSCCLWYASADTCIINKKDDKISIQVGRGHNGDQIINPLFNPKINSKLQVISDEYFIINPKIVKDISAYLSKEIDYDALPSSIGLDGSFKVPFNKIERRMLSQDALTLAQWLIAGEQDLDDVLLNLKSVNERVPIIKVPMITALKRSNIDGFFATLCACSHIPEEPYNRDYGGPLNMNISKATREDCKPYFRLR